MINNSVIQNDLIFEKTTNISSLIGKIVLSKGGTLVGKVKQIRVNPNNGSIEGIVIGRGIFSRSIYVGKSYLARFSSDSIILKVELSILLKGRKVFNSKGKLLGKVVEVVRKGSRNDIEGVRARSFFSRTFMIPRKAMQQIGKSIILAHKYHAPKKYFWQSSE